MSTASFSSAPRLEMRRHRQIVRRGCRAVECRSDRRARRGCRAARLERRRQIDAGENPHRRLRPRRRRRSRIDGEAVRFADAGAAVAAGVRLLPQEISVMPDMTVAENISLADLPLKRRPWLSRRRSIPQLASAPARSSNSSALARSSRIAVRSILFSRRAAHYRDRARARRTGPHPGHGRADRGAHRKRSQTHLPHHPPTEGAVGRRSSTSRTTSTRSSRSPTVSRCFAMDCNAGLFDYGDGVARSGACRNARPRRRRSIRHWQPRAALRGAFSPSMALPSPGVSRRVVHGPARRDLRRFRTDRLRASRC